MPSYFSSAARTRPAARLMGRTNRDRIPMTWLALVQSQPVGSVMLVGHDMPDQPDLANDLGAGRQTSCPLDLLPVAGEVVCSTLQPYL
jgi:hypothetical protein